MCLVELACFLTFCIRIPHVTTSLSDCPIVFIHVCISTIGLATSVSVNYSLMKAAVDFRNVSSTVSVFWLVHVGHVQLQQYGFRARLIFAFVCLLVSPASFVRSEQD